MKEYNLTWSDVRKLDDGVLFESDYEPKYYFKWKDTDFKRVSKLSGDECLAGINFEDRHARYRLCDTKPKKIEKFTFPKAATMQDVEVFNKIHEIIDAVNLLMERTK